MVAGEEVAAVAVAGRDVVVPALISEFEAGGPRRLRDKPPVVSQLLAWHRANSPDGEFGVVVKNAGLIRQVVAYENERAAARASKGHPHARIFHVEPLPSVVPHMRLEPKRAKAGRGWRLQFGHMQGTFRVKVSESQSIFLVTWGQSPKEMSEMAIGSQKAFEVLYERLETKRRRVQVAAPPRGVFSVDTTRLPSMETVTHFVRKALDVENTLRFCSHPMFDALEEDALAFFDNVAWHTRYNQPGMRELLMAGPPGTGKTSIAMALAAKHLDRFLVVYASRGEEVVFAAQAAAAKSRPCIVVAEELDMLVRPDSQTLNWLDGSETPRNTAGTLLIATTNYPRRIDPRILKRPGRIDKLLKVGALRTRHAAAVAKSFLGTDGDALDVRELGRCMDRTTPAEIREIVNMALRGAAPGHALAVGDFEAARASLKQTLLDAEDFGDDDPETREDLHRRLGPMDDLEDDVPVAA